MPGRKVGQVGAARRATLSGWKPASKTGQAAGADSPACGAESPQGTGCVSPSLRSIKSFRLTPLSSSLLRATVAARLSEQKIPFFFLMTSFLSLPIRHQGFWQLSCLGKQRTRGWKEYTVSYATSTETC